MRQFVLTTLNGVTLAALYFIVASGFTLAFGLLRVVNLAHGSLYLFGAYLGWSTWQMTGSWAIALLAAAAAMMVFGAVLQVGLFGWMSGQDMRQALISIGLLIVIADQLLRHYGALTHRIVAPEQLQNPVSIPLAGVQYPGFRLFLVLVALVLGGGLWLLLDRTKLGMMIRAGIDDRLILSAMGVNVNKAFVAVFALGAGLAGLAGAIGGTAFSISPGQDVHYLLIALVVVIIGGMGSLGGAAVGALLVGLTEQFGRAYFPLYAFFTVFLMMVVVLSLRPHGLFGRPA